MKKKVCLAMAVLMAVLALYGCSGGQKNDADPDAGSAQQIENQTDGEKDENDGENGGETDLSAYKKPADAVSIDLTKDDPSNEKMQFTYDDEGKVTLCSYKIGEKQVYVNYTYADGAVHIYAFMGEIVAADETIEITDYSGEKGFTAIEGYYFKGVDAR